MEGVAEAKVLPDYEMCYYIVRDDLSTMSFLEEYE